VTAVFLVFAFRLRQGYGGHVVSAQLQAVSTLHPSPKPRQKLKLLAAHRYIFSVNALVEPGIEEPSDFSGEANGPFSLK
jgi:hypothetical protein